MLKLRSKTYLLIFALVFGIVAGSMGYIALDCLSNVSESRTFILQLELRSIEGFELTPELQSTLDNGEKFVKSVFWQGIWRAVLAVCSFLASIFCIGFYLLVTLERFDKILNKEGL